MERDRNFHGRRRPSFKSSQQQDREHYLETDGDFLPWHDSVWKCKRGIRKREGYKKRVLDLKGGRKQSKIGSRAES